MTSNMTPDLTAMQHELVACAGKLQARRQRARHAGRATIMTAGAVLALSGTAVAANSALDVIDLGGGQTATVTNVKSGIYHYKVNGTDSAGHPIPPTELTSKIDLRTALKRNGATIKITPRGTNPVGHR